MKRLLIVVSGRVQGVGFRFFTQDLAEEYKLSGWVRNRHDGSVEIEVQGEDGIVEKFCEKVRSGPPVATVSEMKIEPLPLKGAREKFRIAY